MLGILLREKADNKRNCECDTQNPLVARTPVDRIILCQGHGCEAHHKYGHIKPPRVIRGVKGVKRAVEKRHHSHKNADAYNPFKPVIFSLRKPDENAHHTEKRQPAPEGRPLDVSTREEHGTRGNIGREEEAFDYIAVYLLLTVHNGVPSEENT